MSDNMTPEMLMQAQKIVDTIDGSSAYALLMQSALQSQKDMLEMLDRSLTMTQALHASEQRSSELPVDIIKFLLPIFATAAIAGSTVTLPNVNSAALVLIGTSGFVGLFGWLVVSIYKLRKLIKKQNLDYEQLSILMDDMRKLADLQRKADSASLDESANAVKELLSMKDQAEQKR